MEREVGVLRVQIELPFYPKYKTLRAWHPMKKNIKYSNSNRKFLDYIRSELEDDPRTQSKFFLTSDLITNECGTAAG